MSGHGNGEAFALNPNAKEWHPSVECKEESQSLGGKLNPNACEWHPSVESTVESRCLYFTFSNGFPLTREQIYHYFTWKYGPCVEFVDIHEPRDYGFPLFGKIIFNFSTIPVLILKGKEKMQFCIDGRPICCKKFKPKNRGA